MTETLAPYACDTCRLRKVSCSRTKPACERCQKVEDVCNYSRSGVIRRKRKRNYEIGTIGANQSATETAHLSSHGSLHDAPGNECYGMLPHSIEDQIPPPQDQAGVRFDDLNPQHKPPEALSSLSELNSAMWFDARDLEKEGYQFFLFREQTSSWVDSFAAALEGGYPILPTAPPEVLEHLRNCQPHLIQDRAWVMMYYSMILSQVSETEPDNHATKRKLRRNIWLTLHDAKLLLEPKELNITALTLLACNAEEFTTPSLCWMLAATACRMLQALGIGQRRLDPETRHRRKMMFWHLNLLDKGLSIIFGRPPTFHRAMAKDVGMPTLEQLMAGQPKGMSSGAPKLFGTHYFHQRLLLTQVMGDVWNCLYEDARTDARRIEQVGEEVDNWYRTARTVLDASAISEKPFLDPAGANSTDIALHCVEFLHAYLLVILYRATPSMRSHCVASSKAMLRVLEHLVPDQDEPYLLSVWQLLCCPFTPFLELFSELVSNGQGASEGNQEIFATMQLLSAYLQRMSQRKYTLAIKLECIAEVFVRHARAVIYPRETQQPSVLTDWVTDPWAAPGQMLDWDAFFDYAKTSSQTDGAGSETLNASDLQAWTSDFFDDAFSNWIGLGSEI